MAVSYGIGCITQKLAFPNEPCYRSMSTRARRGNHQVHGSANHSEKLIDKSRLRLQCGGLGHKAGTAGWIEDNIADAEKGEAGRPACGQGELSSHIAEEPILTQAASMTRLTCCAA
jgi:hypothetical protein